MLDEDRLPARAAPERRPWGAAAARTITRAPRTGQPAHAGARVRHRRGGGERNCHVLSCRHSSRALAVSRRGYASGCSVLFYSLRFHTRAPGVRALLRTAALA